MKAKEQLLNLVSKKEHEKHQYLSEFFKYMPDNMIEEFHYLEVKKNEKILLAGETAKDVYILLDGKVNMDHRNIIPKMDGINILVEKQLLTIKQKRL